MDGRIEKGRETKEKIIKASLELISLEGIKSLSANKIAKAAGVSKSNVFHHFGSVDVIPLKALEYLIEMLMKSLDGGLKDTLEDTLMAIGEYTLTCSPEEHVIYRALFALYNQSFYDERYKVIINKMKALYQSEMARIILYYYPESDEEQVGKLAKSITIVLDGYGYHYMTDNEPEIFMELWKMQVQMIVSALNDKNI